MNLLLNIFSLSFLLASDKTEKKIYVGFHKEINIFLVTNLDEQNVLYSVKFVPVLFQFYDESLVMEENDIIVPFIYEISYIIEQNTKIEIQFIDENNNILFNCIIARNIFEFGRKENVKDIIMFFKDPPGLVNNSNTPILKTDIINVIYGENEYETWVVAENELLLEQIRLSIESFEYVHLYSYLLNYTDKIFFSALKAMRNDIDRTKDGRIEEFILRTVKCYFVITCFTQKTLAVYRNTYLSEEFLVNETIYHGIKKFFEDLKKASNEFSTINESFNALKFYIRYSKVYDPDVIPKIDEQFSLISSLLFRFEKNLFLRISKKEKTLRTISQVPISKQEIETPFKLISILIEHIKIDNLFRLMIFEEEMYYWIRSCIQKESVLRKSNAVNFINLERMILSCNNFNTRPIQSNLSRLLKHTEFKYLTLKKAYIILNNAKNKIEIRQLYKHGLPTEEVVNYDHCLGDVFKCKESIDKIREIDSLKINIPIFTLIVSFLRTN